MVTPAKILPLRQDRTLTEARRQIAAVADLPDQFVPPLPTPEHERLARVLAVALLIEWPDIDSGWQALNRLRAEVPRLADPYGAFAPVLCRAWGLARYEWNLQLEEAPR